MDSGHRDHRPALRAGVDDAAAAPRQHEQVPDRVRARALADEGAHLGPVEDPRPLPQFRAPPLLDAAGPPELGVDVDRPGLAGDEPHVLGEGRRVGQVPQRRGVDVHHAVVGGEQRAHASGQSAQQARQCGVEGLQRARPLVGADTAGVAPVVDVRPVEVDDGRPRAQLAQRRLAPLLQGVGGHVPRPAQRRPGQPRAREGGGRDDGAVHSGPGEALEVGGHALPLLGGRTALEGEEVHGALAVGHAEAHHAGGPGLGACSERGDGRGRGRGHDRVQGADRGAERPQRGGVPEMVLQERRPQPVGQDEQQLAGSRVDAERRTGRLVGSGQPGVEAGQSSADDVGDPGVAGPGQVGAVEGREGLRHCGPP